MEYFLKYLSTAPVLITAWLGFTSIFIMFINYVYPDPLIFPTF
uniref:Photosystem I reaction center subunit IX n=1 Tax=Neotessella volvocina TaxID=52559 RepID=A0A3G2QZW9_9STRA|nr:photosystem I subunit IX [Neotessella volvocina]